MPAERERGTGAARPFRPRSPLVIGLVGGIAAGKSTVADLFAAHDIEHVDADRHARDVAQDPEVLAAVAASLGERFVRGGALDRQALADHVFAEPSARQRLEAILHPRVRARIEAALAAARAAGRSALLDVPLLFEAGLWERCDTIVFVHAPDETRAERARARGWPDDELSRREANQLPIAEKRARSQHVVDNGGTLEATAGQVDRLLRALEVAA